MNKFFSKSTSIVFAMFLTLFSFSSTFAHGKQVPDFHERTNGGNMFLDDNGDLPDATGKQTKSGLDLIAYVFNCPVIKNGKRVGNNSFNIVKYDNNSALVPAGTPNIEAIHNVLGGKFRLVIPAVARLENGGTPAPTSIQKFETVSEATLVAFPELTDYLTDQQIASGDFELQFVGVNLNKKRVTKKWGGVWATKGKLKKYTKFEVRCIFLREKATGKVISCFGCEFFYTK